MLQDYRGITFEDICKRVVNKTPDEIRKIIKGKYRIEPFMGEGGICFRITENN